MEIMWRKLKTLWLDPDNTVKKKINCDGENWFQDNASSTLEDLKRLIVESDLAILKYPMMCLY